MNYFPLGRKVFVELMRIMKRVVVCVGFPKGVLNHVGPYISGDCEMLHIESPLAARSSVRSKRTDVLLIFLPTNASELQISEYCRLIRGTKFASTVCVSEGSVNLKHAIALARAGLRTATELSEDWPKVLRSAVSGPEPTESARKCARLVGLGGWPARYLSASIDVATRKGSAFALAQAMNLTERTLRKKCDRYGVPSPRAALQLASVLYSSYVQSIAENTQSPLDRTGVQRLEGSVKGVKSEGPTATHWRSQEAEELERTILLVRERFGRPTAAPRSQGSNSRIVGIPEK